MERNRISALVFRENRKRQLAHFDAEIAREEATKEELEVRRPSCMLLGQFGLIYPVFNLLSLSPRRDK